jgi:hypothetical protein
VRCWLRLAEVPLTVYAPQYVLVHVLAHPASLLSAGFLIEAEMERQLTDLPGSFVIGDFDVAPDGTEIVFERVQESSSVVLIERPQESDTR